MSIDILMHGTPLPDTAQFRYTEIAPNVFALVVSTMPVGVDEVNANLLIGGVAVGTSNPVPVDQQNDELLEIRGTPEISAAAYAAGNALGGIMQFHDAARALGGSGEIVSISIVDYGQELAPIDVVFFNQAFIPSADTVPFDPTDADLLNCLGFLDVAATDYADFNDNSIATKTSGLRMPFGYRLDAGTSSLWAQAVIAPGGAPTYTATNEITFKLVVRRFS